MTEPEAGVDVGSDVRVVLFFAGMLTLEYERSWTAAERLYLSDYLKSGARGKHRVMSEAVYADHEAWEFYQKPLYLSLAFIVLALFVAVRTDRVRRTVWKHSRRLRGPELVTTAEFNA